MNPKLLVVGTDQPFYRTVYERLTECGLVAAWTSIYRVPPESPLNRRSRIDASCFYDSRHVSSASDVGELLPLSRVQISAMAECERCFMATMDRFSARTESISARKRLFRELLRFFITFFAKHPEVTHVVFRTTPHMGWDIVLFYVARQLGVRTLMLQRTDLNRLYYLRADWRQELRLTTREIGATSAVPDGLAALLEMDSEFVIQAKRSHAHVTRVLANANPWRRAQRLFTSARDWLRLLGMVLRRREFHYSPVFSNEPIGVLALYRLYITKAAANTRQLREYLRLCQPADLAVPYVYYALHYQPERSTQPEGMEYGDQFLAISTLAAALPSGWFLYVKEHPRQFDSWPPDLRRMHARSVDYYREIAGLPRVRLLAPNSDSSTLISGARLCSTVTGSTGWEALKKGKPTVVFGYPWYSACGSCAVVHGVADAAAAMTSLDAKAKSDVDGDVRAFLRDLEPYLLPCHPGRHYDVSEAEHRSLGASVAWTLTEAVHGRWPVL